MAKTISPLQGSARRQPQPIRTKGAQLAVVSWGGRGHDWQGSDRPLLARFMGWAPLIHCTVNIAFGREDAESRDNRILRQRDVADLIMRLLKAIG